MSAKTLITSFAATLLCVGICRADVIDFSGLAGPNGTPYFGSVEGNYTVTVNTGNWFEAFLNGNPTPDIFGNSRVGSVDVTENTTGLFQFSSVDLDDASSGGFTYSINGFLSGSNVLSFGGTFPGGSFPTIASTNPLQVLDRLNIQINSTTTSYNVDNIVVRTVPEPATLGLVLTGLCFGLRRRR